MKTFVLPLAVDNSFAVDAIDEITRLAAALGGTVEPQAAVLGGVRAARVEVQVPSAHADALLDRLAESELVRMAVADTPDFEALAPVGFMAKVAAAQERADARFDADCAADRARQARAALDRLSENDCFELKDRLDDARRLIHAVRYTSPRYPNELGVRASELEQRYKDMARSGSLVVNPVETATLLLEHVALAGRYAKLYTLGTPDLMERLNTAAQLVPAFVPSEDLGASPVTAPVTAPVAGPRR